MTPPTRGVAGVVAGGLLLVMAWAQYSIRTHTVEPLATAVLMLAALVAAVLVGRMQEAPSADNELPPLRLHRSSMVLVSVGVAALVAASVVLSVRWRRFFVVGVLLLLVGVALLSIGLWRAQPRSMSADRQWTWGEAGVLLAIVVVALGLRFFRCHDFPPAYGIFAIEEPQTGMGGAIILDGYRPWEFLVDHYLAALALRLGGPSLPALRVPFTLFSALTVLPLYALLRQVVRMPAALFGTFLLAISSWHLGYARCAHNIFLGTFVVVSVWALLVHAERTHRLAVYPWIGVLTGSTLFGYAGYRGTVGMVLLFLVLAMARHWHNGRRAGAGRLAAVHAQMLRRDLAGAAVTAVVVVAMIPPLVLRVYTDPHPNYSYFEAAHRSLANHDYYTSDIGDFLAQRLERVRAAAAIFLHHGDESPSFNLPGEPMLDPVTGTLFGAGLLYAICFPRRRHNGYFLAVFAVLFVGGAVFVQNLDVRRLQGLVPLVCLFAALFVDAALGAADRLGHGGVRALVLLGALGTAAFAWNDHAFQRWANDPEVRRSFHNEYLALARLGREDARGRYLAIVSDLSNFFGENDYKWLIRGQIAGQNVTDLLAILPPHELPGAGRPVSIVLLPPYDDPGIPELLRQVYPGTQCRVDVTPEAADLRMTVCDLPGHSQVGATSFLGTLTATYVLRDDAPPILVRSEPFIAHAVVPDVCRSRAREPEVPNCRVEWSGSFELPSAALVRLAPEARDGSLTIAIDGQRVRGRMRLAAGLHTFKASATYARGPASGAQLRWRVGAGPAVLMPFHTSSGEP